MSALSEHRDGLKELQEELGADCPSIVWNGEAIKILPGSISLQTKNSMGGFSIESDFMFTCLTLDFSGMPASNQPITYRSQPLKIVNVTVADGGMQLRIAANHAAHGL